MGALVSPGLPLKILFCEPPFGPNNSNLEHTEMIAQDTAKELASYRKTIDNLDSAVLHILAERFRCTEQVGHLKAEKAMPATDSERERHQMDRLKNIADDLGLSHHFVESLMKLIVGTVVERHKEIAAEIKVPFGLAEPRG